MGAPRRSRKKRRVPGPANSEARAGKVISAYRDMVGTDSEALAGIVHELDFNEELLQLEKVPRRHTAYILDPRVVNRHFKRGFEQGFNVARAFRRIQAEGDDYDDNVSASIGEIHIGRRKHVFARLASKQLCAEMVAIKEILGQEGLHGVNGKRARRAAGPVIYLAQLAQPLPDREAEIEFADALDAALVVHGLTEVTFGEIQVWQRDARG